MSEPLPKWEMRMYAKLWKKFQTKEFSYEQTIKTLKEKKGEAISVFLSDLKKLGWLEVALNPKDARKRVYRLKAPDKAINEMAK